MSEPNPLSEAFQKICAAEMPLSERLALFTAAVEEHGKPFAVAYQNLITQLDAAAAGVTAPAGKKMGHAGAIVSGGKGTAQGKMDALREAGVQVGLNPTEAGELMVEIIRSQS